MASETDDGLSLSVLTQPDTLADPYPFYHRLRAAAPVRWDEESHGWVLTRYADVLFAARDPRLSADRASGYVDWLPAEAHDAARAVYRAYAQQILFLDPPTHTRLRALMSKAFTPRVVEGMRPRIQRLVDEMLDAAQDAGQMDVIADLAYPLPATVIAELLGVPMEDRDQFKAWSNDMATDLDADYNRPERGARAVQGVAALLDYMQRLVSERRTAPRDDFIQALIAASEHGDVMSEAEVVANCVLLLVAGHETTTNLIGNGLLALLRHPAQIRRLHDEPALIGSAVEELLRYDSPVQLTGRVVADDVEISGTRIGRGAFVVMLVGAANRDPAQFAEPDRLDVCRAENRHLSFLHGIHFCLGAALARLEGQIALGTVLRRFPAMQLATQTPRWRDNLTLRGLRTLPVIFA